MNSNLFITFEGPEGAGKTTVIQMIAERLTKNNIEVLATREPGGIEIAEKIRTIILNPAHTAMDERTEALLYAAARSLNRENASPIPGTRGSCWYWGAYIVARVSGLSTEPCSLAPPPSRAAR